MKLYRVKSVHLLLVITVVVLVGHAAAQSSGASETARKKYTYRFSYTSIYQFDTDMDGGGSFDVQRHFLRFDVARTVDRHWMIGLGLSFDYERWNFSDIEGLAGIDLWDALYRPGISLPVFYRTGGNWQFGFIPSIDFAGASGAETGESISYGAVLSAGYAFGPDLTIGLGAGVFDRLDQSDMFPFIMVDWTISDRWRLGNPFQAGPVGPAGLELVYRPGDRLEMGIGGAFRSYRFRLDDSSAVADGIGQVDFLASFLRVGWQLGPRYQIDINGGALFDGTISIEDENGNELGETDYDTAPFVGVTLRGRF